MEHLLREIVLLCRKPPAPSIKITFMPQEEQKSLFNMMLPDNVPELLDLQKKHSLQQVWIRLRWTFRMNMMWCWGHSSKLSDFLL
jgi:hypothetical protein